MFLVRNKYNSFIKTISKNNLIQGWTTGILLRQTFYTQKILYELSTYHIYFHKKLIHKKWQIHVTLEILRSIWDFQQILELFSCCDDSPLHNAQSLLNNRTNIASSINLDLSRLKKDWGSHNLVSFNSGKTQCCLIYEPS